MLRPGEALLRSRWLRLAVGVACVTGFAIWAVASVDVSTAGLMFFHADLLTLLLEVPALVLLIWLMRAVRWHLILVAIDARPSFFVTYLSIAVSLGLAAITPLQAGETLKIAYAKQQHGIPFGAGAGGFLVERMMDVVILVIVAYVASHLLLFPGIDFAVFAIVTICFCLVVGLVAAWLAYRFAPDMIVELARGVRGVLVRPALYLGVLVASVLCWTLTIILWRKTLLSVNIEVSFAMSSLLVGIVTLAGVALLVPGSIGVSEATVAALFLRLGFPPEVGLTGALALRVITFVAVGLGAVHWLLLRVLRRMEQ